MTGDKGRPVLQLKKLSMDSDRATQRSSFDPSIAHPSSSRTSEWARAKLLQLPVEFYLKAIGMQWIDELRMRQQIITPMPLAVHVTHDIDHHNRVDYPELKALLSRIMSRVDSPNSRSNPEKLNDFFNGFDLVAEDLLNRL